MSADFIENYKTWLYIKRCALAHYTHQVMHMFNKQTYLQQIIGHKEKQCFSFNEIMYRSLNFYWTGMMRHIERHGEESPVLKYKCPVCGKAYRYAASLLKHEQSTHKKRKPYTCNICGKGRYDQVE